MAGHFNRAALVLQSALRKPWRVKFQVGVLGLRNKARVHRLIRIRRRLPRAPCVLSSDLAHPRLNHRNTVVGGLCGRRLHVLSFVERVDLRELHVALRELRVILVVDSVLLLAVLVVLVHLREFFAKLQAALCAHS